MLNYLELSDKQHTWNLHNTDEQKIILTLVCKSPPLSKSKLPPDGTKHIKKQQGGKLKNNKPYTAVLSFQLKKQQAEEK